jgi:hypothetical protein
MGLEKMNVAKKMEEALDWFDQAYKAGGGGAS